MNLIRALITFFIVSIAILSGLGIFWWNDPPEKLAPYATGGQIILVILIVSSVAGLWRLWKPAEPRT